MTQPYTPHQIRKQFLDQIETYVDYWAAIDGPRNAKERLEGLVHSILSMIDGSTLLPAFRIAADPSPEDRQFYESEGEQWYPCNRNVKLEGDSTDRELFNFLRYEWNKRRPGI